MKPLSVLKRLYYGLLRGDEYSRYLLAEKAASLFYKTYKFSDYGRIFLRDSEFIGKYESLVGKTNYHSLDRKYTMNQLLKLAKNVAGDTVECGVYEGASSYWICKATQGTNKKHHVFDSFQGLSEPCTKDGVYWKKGDLSAAENIVKQNLSDFDFVEYHKGFIPDKFHEVEERRFSFVHIDVDLYQPTLDSLKFFYQRTCNGGLILCDDYGFMQCPGAKKAMDTFFNDKPEAIIALPTGQAFILKS